MNRQDPAPTLSTHQNPPRIPMSMLHDILAGSPLPIDSKAAEWARQDEKHMDADLPPPMDAPTQAPARL